jgi:hypothetical protein
MVKLKELGVLTSIPRGWSSPANTKRRQAYNSWTMMLHRCYDPTIKRYDLYGGMGVTVAPRWLNFKDFLEDMGLPPSSKHSIDRVDNDGNYSPDNCRWATQREQCRNSSQSHRITINGQTKSLSDWADIYSISAKVLNDRINKLGWDIDKAINTPLQSQFSQKSGATKRK